MTLYTSYQRPNGIISDDFINLLQTKEIITCPWGHNLNDMINLHNKTYTDEAKNQDKHFVNKLKVGDYVIVPLPNREFLLKKIVNLLLLIV